MSPAAVGSATKCRHAMPFWNAGHGHTEHMLGQCQALRASQGAADVTARPVRPRDALQSKLAWPCERVDLSTMAWAVHVRRRVLDHRDGHVTGACKPPQ